MSKRDAGSRRSGLIADAARFCRARFKHELLQCRSDEQQTRSDSLAYDMQKWNSSYSLKDNWLICENKRKLLQTMDGFSGDKTWAQICKYSYSDIFNSVVGSMKINVK